MEQQDKILVFLKPAFMWNSSVMVLQALDFPILEEISRAVFGKSSGFKTKKKNKKPFTIVSKYIHIDVCKIV